MRTRDEDINNIPYRIAWGLAASGGGMSAGASPDVSSVRNSVGNYTVTFSPPFPAIPVTTITSFGGAQKMASITGATASSFTVAFAATSGGAGVDTSFNFIAVGVGDQP